MKRIKHSKWLLPSIALTILVVGAVLFQYFRGSNHMSFEILQAKTGIKAVYYVYDDTIESTTAELLYEFGEGDLAGVEGMAYYLEHLVASNALPQSQSDPARDWNAWTNKINTAYFMSSKSPEEIFDYLAGTMKPIELSPEFMEEEAGIVYREFQGDYDSDPDLKHYTAFNKLRFEGTGLARSTIGYPEEIKEFDYQEAIDIHNQHYTLKNATLSVRTPLSKRKITSLINKAFGDLQTPPAKERALLTQKISAPPLSQETIEDQNLKTETHITSFIAPLPDYSKNELQILLPALIWVLTSSQPDMLYRKLELEENAYLGLNIYTQILPGTMGISLEAHGAAVKKNQPYLGEALKQALQNMPHQKESIADIWQAYLEEVEEDEENWEAEDAYSYLNEQLYSAIPSPMRYSEFATLAHALTSEDVIALASWFEEQSLQTDQIWKGTQK